MNGSKPVGNKQHVNNTEPRFEERLKLKTLTNNATGHTFVNVRRVRLLSGLGALLLFAGGSSRLLARLFLLCGGLAGRCLSGGRGLLLCFGRHCVFGMDGLSWCFEGVLVRIE